MADDQTNSGLGLSTEELELIAKQFAGAVNDANSSSSSGPSRGPETPGESFDWQTKLRTDVVSAIEKWASVLGVEKFVLDSYVRDSWDMALHYVNSKVAVLNGTWNVDPELGDDPRGPAPNVLNPAQYNAIWEAATEFYSKRLGFDVVGDVPRVGGGGGSRGPTAAEIRSQFDMDQLEDAVQQMWGQHLFEDTTKAKSIAKQYVDAVVQNYGKKEVDFKTFVLNRIEKSPRYQMIYQNKPEGMSALEYVAPYASMANSVVGGGSGDTKRWGTLAAGGAALGASPDAFAERLKRTDEHQNSVGFINGLESRVRNIKNVLRG